MRLMARTAPRMAATACVAGALLAGATAAWAFDPASPSPVGHSPDAVVALFAGAVHGDSTWAYADGSTRSTSGDYGRISGLGRGSIEIRRADGVTVTVATSDATCVRNQGLPARFRSLRLGERALVIQEDGSAIVVRAGRPLFRPLFSCGLLGRVVHGDSTMLYADGTTREFAYDRGTIESTGDGQLSLARADGQTVEVTTDDSTAVFVDCERSSLDALVAGESANVISEAGHADVIHAMS